MGDQEVPPARKRKGEIVPAGSLMTYDEAIPRYSSAELGLTGLPNFDTPTAYETTYFGWVTVRRLTPNFFEEQRIDYEHLTPEQKDHLATALRHKHREVTFSSQIQHHPNIMKICAFIEEIGTPNISGIVLERAPLGTVEQYIQSGARLTPTQIYNWALQLARTMNYFHTKFEIMHRDIRPANIYVFEGGAFIKLSNFGYAKLQKGQEDRNSCRRDPNMIYSAPEMIDFGNYANYSYSADVWSFGMFLYFITHNRNPFTLGNESALSFRKKLESGVQPRIDDNVTDQQTFFRDLMHCCWRLERTDEALETRPTFAKLVQFLIEHRNLFD